MSWKGWGKPWRKGGGRGQQFSGSQYYPSSEYGNAQAGWEEDWSKSNKKDARKGEGKPVFPAYNQQQKGPVTVIAEQTFPSTPAEMADDAIKEIQKAVNMARKAEQRVSKLQTDLQVGQTQWRNYEKSLKEAFLKERTKFQGDQNRLRQELAEALAAQAQTRSALRTAAVGQLQEAGAASPQDVTEMDGEWEALMLDKDIVEESEQRMEMNGWLQQELDRMGSPQTAAAAKLRIAAAMKGKMEVSGHATSTPPHPPNRACPLRPESTKKLLLLCQQMVRRRCFRLGTTLEAAETGCLLFFERHSILGCQPPPTRT